MDALVSFAFDEKQFFTTFFFKYNKANSGLFPKSVSGMKMQKSRCLEVGFFIKHKQTLKGLCRWRLGSTALSFGVDVGRLATENRQDKAIRLPNVGL